MDIQEIASKIRDSVRVQVAHRSVHVSGDDMDAIGNFILTTLSKYEDNQLMQLEQFNPQTNRVEKIQELPPL
jgi:hypothetical protein